MKRKTLSPSSSFVADAAADASSSSRTEQEQEQQEQAHYSHPLSVYPHSMLVDKLNGSDSMPCLVKYNDVSALDYNNGVVDMLLCLDMSTSMRQTLPDLVQAVKHLSNFDVHSSGVDVNLGLGYFNSKPYFPELNFHSMRDKKTEVQGGEDALSSLLSSFCDDHIHNRSLYPGTNFLTVLQRGLNVLSNRRSSLLNDESKSVRMQHLVVLTDGYPDYGISDSSVLDAIKDGVGDASVVVHVMLLGEHVNLDLAKSMVSVTNGALAYADTGSDLKETFDRILVPIRTSSLPLTVKIRDRGERTRVLHGGILTPTNCSILTHINVPPKPDHGFHIGACFDVLDIGRPSAASIPPFALYLKFIGTTSPQDVAEWNDESTNAPPEPLVRAMRERDELEAAVQAAVQAAEEGSDGMGFEETRNVLRSRIDTMEEGSQARMSLEIMESSLASREERLSRRMTSTAMTLTLASEASLAMHR